MQENAAGQAMKIIRNIQQDLSENDKPAARLENMLRFLTEGLNADAAICYTSVDDNSLEIFGVFGIKSESVPRTVRLGEGFAGEIAASKRSLSCSENVGFGFSAALGTPLLRWNKIAGLVVVFSREERVFTPEESETLETLGLFLSEMFSSEEMVNYKKNLIRSRGVDFKDHLKGVVLNKGYGVGYAVVHRRRQALNRIFAEDKVAELNRLNDAKDRMNKSLDEKFNATRLGLGEHVDILEAYRMFAKDKGWYKKISDNIEKGLTAEAAVERAYEDMWNRLSGSTDVYLKERLHDLRDVADRLQLFLSGEKSDVASALGDVIIVAQTMGPADLMDYDYKKIRGLIIEDGTPTMHVAIVARALNIPVIAKIHGIYKDVKDNEILALDGENGFVYTNPSEEIVQKFKSKQKNMAVLLEQLKKLRRYANKTLDGVKINLSLNIGLDFDLNYLDSTKCDGIGLYRTEIPFMSSAQMPDVASQTECYKTLLDRAGNKKVIFRSLDVGSDKLLPYWSDMKEDNPAIGWRSIRITLDRRAILRQQMKAFLNAAAGRELNVMFPMIASLEEFLEARETLLLEYDKHKRRGEKLPSKLNIGLMIEVPSIIFQLDDVLKYADFISVGTNDLAQFIFACDRGNPRITDRYDVLSAPFLRVMREIVKKADKAGVPCSVCGEMGGSPLEAMALIGLGYRRLSMAGSAYANVKNMIRTLRVDDITDYVQTLLRSPQRTLRPQLSAYAYDHGIAF